jgi:hypothetical protein
MGQKISISSGIPRLFHYINIFAQAKRHFLGEPTRFREGYSIRRSVGKMTIFGDPGIEKQILGLKNKSWD